MCHTRRGSTRLGSDKGVTALPSNSPYPDLGLRLKFARIAKKLSQPALAELAGVSPQTISKIETGNSVKPGLDTMERLAYALGYPSVNDLLSGALPPTKMDAGAGILDRRGRPVPDINAVPVEAYRAASGGKPLPVYRWGSAGDPTDSANSPYPDHEAYPPVGKEGLIGPHGFGVVVKGDSMVGRGINEGDIVWVNPDKPPRQGGIVLGRMYEVDGSEKGMVVKTLAGQGLHSADCHGTGIVNGGRFDVIGPVVWISPEGFAPR